MRAVLCDSCQTVGGVKPITPADGYGVEHLPNGWKWVMIGDEEHSNRYEVCSNECAAKVILEDSWLKTTTPSHT